MKNQMKRALFLVTLLICSLSAVRGSHLVGGNIDYEYIGDVGGGMYRYVITLTVYNNCDSTSNVPLPVANHSLAVYEQDINGNPMGGGNKVLFNVFTLPLIDSNFVSPPVVSGCSIGGNVCIYKGVYRDTIDLPLNFNGYHLYFQNFARNNTIDNLLNPGGTAMGFHAYIPANLVVNNSPIFTDDPVPFLCVGDTVSILNTAYDPDGDLLIFSFVEPMAGTNGFFPPAPDPMPWPINTVNWLNGTYNQNNPFGPGGYAFIDGNTGLTQYMSPAVGNYAVAVEVREFRNGNLIGVTRRDLQLLVITCPPNDAPNIDPLGTTQIQFSVEEGDSICFDIDFVDGNGDSLMLDAGGVIFDPLITNPPATIGTPITADSVVNTQFCWNTACGQAQPLPYLFTISVTDNGCPPKTTNEVYSITVTEPTAPTAITGPVVVCEFSSGSYGTDTIPGSTYQWTVTGGTITSGQGTPNIDVDWGPAGPGLVEVFAISQFGCASSAITLNVTILALPNADAGPDTTICLGDTVQIGGSPTGPLGATFGWGPFGQLDDQTFANPLAWPNQTTDFIVVVDVGGLCIGTDTVRVTVGNPNIDAGLDTTICPGGTAQLLATGGVTYVWTPGGTLNDPNIPNPTATPATTTTYFVSVTDGGGCIGQDSVVVTIATLPTVDAGADTAICDGFSVQIGGTPTGPAGSTFSWSPAATLDDGSLANPTATPVVSPTTYTVTVTDQLGCVDTDDITVTLNPNPTADAGVDTSICAGDSVQLIATGGVSYSWAPTTGLSNPNIANPMASPGSTTTYTVTVTDNNGCVDTDDVTVTILTLPVVDAGPDQIICIGDTVQIGGAPTGPAGSTFSWTPAASLDDPNLSNPLAFPVNNTTYTVTVTDNNGCVNASNVSVSVNSLPVVDAGADTAICDGASVQIGGTPTGPAGSTYAWTPAATLDDGSLANPTATPTVSPTTYTVVVTDGNGCINTDDITVTLNPNPTADAGVDTSICAGDSVQLAATGGVSYSWSPITGLSNPNIANPMASPGATTTYTVTVTDNNGCTDTDDVTVTILPLPVVDAGSDQIICIGDTVQLGGAPTGPAGSTFSWTPAGSLDDPNLANPLAFPVNNTTYTVTVTDNNGCVNSSNVSVSVNPLPVVDAGPDSTICDGSTIQLGGTPTGPAGSTYAWTPAADLDDATLSNPTATPVANPTQYIVVVTDVNGCINSDTVVISLDAIPNVVANPDTAICAGDSAQLLATGAVTYVWTPTNGLNDPNIANPMASPATTTEYFVTGTDANGCQDTDSITVTVNPLPTVDAGADIVICAFDTVAIGGAPTGPAGATFSWTPTTDLDDASLANPMAFPLTTTSYIVLVTDGLGCFDRDTMTVTVNPLPVVDAGADMVICFADTVPIGGAPTGPAGSTIAWTPATGLSDAAVANPDAFPTVTTQYIVTVTDINGCIDTDTMTVTVNPLPVVSAGNDTSICIGDSAQLLATGATIYSWSPTTGLSDPNIANPLAGPTDTITYVVTGTDGNGCVSTDTITVNVMDLPIVDAGPDLWLCLGDSIQLLATGGVTYAWSPGTGLSDPNIDNPMAGPTDTTTYIVTVTDANMCINTDTMTIVVNDDPPLFAGNDTTICLNDTVMLGGNPTSVAGSTFTWTPAASLDDPTLSNPMAFPTVTTTYYVTAVNDTCMSMDSVTVIVNQLPPANAGPDTAVCFLDSIQLQATGGTVYEWIPGTGLSDSLIANPMASPSDTTTYIVAVYDALGCLAFDTMTLIVNPLPIAEAGPDVQVCVLDSVQLQASGGTTYSWSPTTGLSDPNIADPLASPSDTTTYYVTVTDSNGCSSIDSMMVIVNPPPIVDAGPDATICNGESTQLNATGGVSYVWTPDIALSDDSIANPLASPLTTIMYHVSVTDTNGCVNTDSVTVNVNQLPLADAGPDLQICIGGQAHLNATGGVTYSWSPPGDLTDPNIADPWANPTDTTTYIVTVTDANGCTTTDTMVLIVNPLPTADAGPDVNLCYLDTAQLVATGGVQYTWTPNMFISDTSIANPQVWPDTTMSYVVTVRDSNLCEQNDTVVVNVFRIVAWGDTAVCEGDSAQLNAGGPGAVSFSWSPTTGLSDPNIANPLAAPATTTTYTVTVTNGAGCTDQASAQVDVVVNPTASFTSELDPDCAGMVVDLTNTSTNSDTYLWDFGNGETSTEENVTVTMPFGQDFTINLTAYNSSGCFDNTSFTSTVLAFTDYFDIQIPNVFTPNNDGVNDRFEINVGQVLSECTEISIFNRWGQIMFLATGRNVVWDGRTSAGVEVPSGTYFYTLSINGIEYRGHVTVIR